MDVYYENNAKIAKVCTILPFLFSVYTNFIAFPLIDLFWFVWRYYNWASKLLSISRPHFYLRISVFGPKSTLSCVGKAISIWTQVFPHFRFIFYFSAFLSVFGKNSTYAPYTCPCVAKIKLFGKFSSLSVRYNPLEKRFFYFVLRWFWVCCCCCTLYYVVLVVLLLLL